MSEMNGHTVSPQVRPANADIENGGDYQDHDKPAGFRLRMSAIIEDFSFLWFTVAMNTGLLSILMHQLPYQFHGLGVLSTIMFVFVIVLFTLFFGILLLRIALFPEAIVKSCTSNLQEAGMIGAVPIAWFTIVAQVGLTASQASWGGRAWFLVAYVLWWIGTAVMVAVAVAVVTIVSKHRIADTEKLTPALILPFVGTTTNALVGGLIVQYSHGVTADLAIPVIVVCYMLTGIGFFAAMMIYATYLVRLTNTGMPKGFQSPSLFLLVGPCGQSSAALQILGRAAATHFGDYARGNFLTSSSGSVLAAVGTLLGLMLTGFGLLFTLFGVYVIVEIAIKRQHKYSMLWWSTIFPLGTINTAFILFASDLDSRAFRVLAAILLVILWIDYLANWGFTLRDIYLGKLLNGRRSENPASDRVKRQ